MVSRTAYLHREALSYKNGVGGFSVCKGQYTSQRGHGEWPVLSEQSEGGTFNHKEGGRESPLGRGHSVGKEHLKSIVGGHGFSPLEKVSLVQGF